MWRKAQKGIEQTVQIFTGTRRRRWLTFIVFLLLVSYGIVSSSVNRYSASVTIFVDLYNRHILDRLAKGATATTWLEDALITLRPMILRDDFIEPHIMQELQFHRDDVVMPPMRLRFMSKIVDTMKSIRNIFSNMWEKETVTWNADQKIWLDMRDSVKKNIAFSVAKGGLLTISYTGPNPTVCQNIVGIVTNQCKELLLRSRNQKVRETWRYSNRQYEDVNQRVEELQQQLLDLRGEQFEETPENRTALLQQRQHALDELRMLDAESQVLAEEKHDVMQKQTDRREHILEATPDMLAAYLHIAKPRDMQYLEEKKMRLTVLEQVYRNNSGHREMKELKTEIALREEQLQQDIADTETMRTSVLLADPIYTDYARQIAEIETFELANHVKKARLRTNVALHEEKIAAISDQEKHFHALQLEIDVYRQLLYGYAKERDAARVNMDLMKARGNWFPIVGRSYPDQPLWGSPRDIVLMLWALVVLFIILAFLLSRLFRFVKTCGIKKS